MRNRPGNRKSLFVAVGAAWCLVWGCGNAGAALAPVVVPNGQPLQIAVAVDDTGFGSSFAPSVREAVQMAIERHPTIRGFAIQVNAFSAPCDNGSLASLAGNTAIANAIVGNAQNVAVIGHACSGEASAWLPVYQAANLVAINGSTTGTSAAPLAPTVFDGMAVPDPDFTPWYATVKTLASDQRWRSSFQARFGTPAADYADLYYDATNVLLTAIQETAHVDGRDLVVDPAALASTVRHTSALPGVSCSITLDPATGDRIDDTASLARCASASSEIVFASDRASANPGEIFSLARGRDPLDVSHSPAVDAGAAIAPNGKRIAFWSDRSGAMRLYLARRDGTGLRLVPAPVPATGAYGAPLSFSPDGSRLLAASSNGSSCRLFVVELRSLHATRIPVGGLCGTAAWSADSLRIAVPVGRRTVVADTAGHRLFSLAGSQALWSSRGDLAVANVAALSNGANPTKTTVADRNGKPIAHLPGAAAAWSPDGGHLLLTRPGALVLADPARPARSRTLVRGPKDWSPYGVAFTPDGGFARYLSASGKWMLIRTTGGAPRLLPGFGVWSRDGRYAFPRPLPSTPSGLLRVVIEIGDRFGRRPQSAGTFVVDDHWPSILTWSADGSQLIYELGRRAPRDLWAVNADGSNLHRLTSSGFDTSAPAWSADGMRLAYVTAPFSGANCGFCSTSVVIAGPDASPLSPLPGRVPGQESGDGSPSWAPTGTLLAVSVCCSGELDIVGADGSGRRALAPPPAGSFANPGLWSSDGGSIAYLDGRGIGIIAPDGSGQRLEPAAAGNQPPNALAWSHDGKLLAYSAPDGIHVLPADGSAPPRLLIAEQSPGGLSFSPDDTQLVYAAQRSGPSALPQNDLFVISVQGGPARALAPSPFNDGDPAWQPLPGS